MDLETTPEQQGPSFFELAYGIIFNPRAIFERLAVKDALKPAFWLLLVYYVVNALTNVVIAIPEQLSQLGEGEAAYIGEMLNSPGVELIIGLVGIVTGLCLWVVLAGIYNILAEILGGKGNGKQVLTVTGISMLPNVLLTPWAILLYVLQWDMRLYNVISFIMAIYTAVVLPVMGISRIHHLSTGRAIAIVISPLLLLIAAIVLVTVIAVWLGMQIPY